MKCDSQSKLPQIVVTLSLQSGDSHGIEWLHTDPHTRGPAFWASRAFPKAVYQPETCSSKVITVVASSSRGTRSAVRSRHDGRMRLTQSRQVVGVEDEEAHSRFGSALTCRRYSRMFSKTSSRSGWSFQVAMRLVQGCSVGRPTSSSTTSTSLSLASSCSFKAVNVASRVSAYAESSKGWLTEARYRSWFNASRTTSTFIIHHRTIEPMNAEVALMVLSRAQFLAKRIQLKPDFEQFSDHNTKVAGLESVCNTLGERGFTNPAVPAPAIHLEIWNGDRWTAHNRQRTEWGQSHWHMRVMMHS